MTRIPLNQELADLIRDCGLSAQKLEVLTGVPRSTIYHGLAHDRPFKVDRARVLIDACTAEVSRTGRVISRREWLDFGSYWESRLKQAYDDNVDDRYKDAAARYAVEERKKLRRPRQLPAGLHPFVGRTDAIEQLDRWLADATAAGAGLLVAIDGIPGVGKSSLAVHWARGVSSRSPRGVLHVDLRAHDPDGPPVSPEDVLRSFVRALGAPPDDLSDALDELVHLYRTVVGDDAVLVVLDNAADEEQVRPLLPPSPGSLVIVTSRPQLRGLVARERARPLSLTVFTDAEARQMLAGSAASETSPPDVLDELIAISSNLPLALGLITARAEVDPGVPLGDVVARLRSTDPLDLLPNTVDPRSDVRQVFSWSYRLLSPGAAAAFRLLGLHPGPDVSITAARSLLDVDESVPAVLDELVRARLVREDDGRYAMHDLMRAYAVELAQTVDPPVVRSAARRRMLDHYTASAQAAALGWDPHRDPLVLEPASSGMSPESFADPKAALHWLSVEYPVLLRVVDQACHHRLPHGWQIAWSLVDYFNRQARWADWIEVMGRALEAARAVDDRLGTARMHRGLGGANRVRNRIAEARVHLEQALALFTELGETAASAHLHIDLSILAEEEERLDDALRQALLAERAYQAVGDEVGAANALNAAGWMRAQVGDLVPALDDCQQALATLREHNDAAGIGAALDSLGYILARSDRSAEAVEHYTEAIELFAANDDPIRVADSTEHLGDAYELAGEIDPARQQWRRALRGFAELAVEDRADRLRQRLAGGDDEPAG